MKKLLFFLLLISFGASAQNKSIALKVASIDTTGKWLSQGWFGTFLKNYDSASFLGGKYYNKTFIDANLASKSPLAGSSSITTVGTIGSGVWQGTSIGSNFGGAGTVSGIMQANGTGTVSAAVAGTDYLSPNAAISLSAALGTTNPALTLYNSTATAAGNISRIAFRANNTVGGNETIAYITATNPNAATNNGGQLTLATSLNGAATLPITRLTIDNTGATTITGTIAASNLSGTNTGDNAVNTLYSGLATSKVNISDTSTMLGNYVRTPNYGITKTGQAFGVDTSALSTKVNVTALLTGYTAGASVVKYTDTAAMLTSRPNLTYVTANLATKSPLAGSSSITTLGTISSGTWNGTSIGSNFGGAGTVNGILKANGSGTVSAATAGTDYLSPNAALSVSTALGTTNPALTLYNSTAAAAGNISQILFRANNVVGGNEVLSSITSTNPNAATNNGGNLVFATSLNGTATTPTTRLTIDNTGAAVFGYSVQSTGKLYVGNTTVYLDYNGGGLDLATGSAIRANISSAGLATFNSSISATKFIGGSSTPSKTNGASTVIGSTGSVSLTGNDAAMRVSISVSGTAPSAVTAAVTVTFATAYSSAPIVVLQNEVGTTGQRWDVANVTTTGFEIRPATVLTSGGYSVGVHVIQ
jgi:hypothetical protein